MTFSVTKGTDRRINFQFYLSQALNDRSTKNDTATRGQVLPFPASLWPQKASPCIPRLANELENYFALDNCCCFLHHMKIVTLDTCAGHLAEPATPSSVPAQQYLFSIYIYYLHTWLPGQCQCGCRLAASWKIKVRPAEPGFTSQVAGGFATMMNRRLRYIFGTG